MKKIFLLLTALAVMTACNNGGDDSKGRYPLELTEGTSTSQSIAADRTTVADAIRFYATAAWYAQIDPATTKAGGSNVDWLTLSQYSGDQGDFSLTLTLTPNTTGKERTADIRIICGEMYLLITVTQTTTPGGDDPKPEMRKVATATRTSDQGTDKTTFTFNYDGQNRIKSLDYTSIFFENGKQYSDTGVCTITYAQDVVTYEMTVMESDETETAVTGSGTAQLNAKGYATTLKLLTRDNDKGSVYEWNSDVTLSYNASDYLIETKMVDTDESGSDTRYHYLSWTDGNMTSVKWNSLTDRADYSTTIENKANIDMNWLLYSEEGLVFATGDPSNIFSLMGICGKRSKNMVTATYAGYRDGKMLHKYEYEVDSDGYPVKISEYQNTDFSTSGTWKLDNTYTFTYSK